MMIFRHAMAFAVLSVLAPLSSVQAGVIVGRPAPAFRATTFDGTKLSLTDFKGEVLVINIWATWCGPCKKELPLLDSFYRIVGKNGLRVVAVTTEDSVPASVLKPLQKLLAFPLARAFSGSYGAIGGAVPTNFVIDRNGVVRYAKAGAFDLATLNQVLIPLLNESRPAD